MLVWSNRLLFSLGSVKIRGDKLPSLSNDVMYNGNFEALKTSKAIEAVTVSAGFITLLVRLFDLQELSTSLSSLWFR